MSVRTRTKSNKTSTHDIQHGRWSGPSWPCTYKRDTTQTFTRRMVLLPSIRMQSSGMTVSGRGARTDYMKKENG